MLKTILLLSFFSLHSITAKAGSIFDDLFERDHGYDGGNCVNEISVDLEILSRSYSGKRPGLFGGSCTVTISPPNYNVSLKNGVPIYYAFDKSTVASLDIETDTLPLRRVPLIKRADGSFSIQNGRMCSTRVGKFGAKTIRWIETEAISVVLNRFNEAIAIQTSWSRRAGGEGLRRLFGVENPFEADYDTCIIED